MRRNRAARPRDGKRGRILRKRLRIRMSRLRDISAENA
jgi:hypothetical protein